MEVVNEGKRMGLQGVKNEGRWVGKPPMAMIRSSKKQVMRRTKGFSESTNQAEVGDGL